MKKKLKNRTHISLTTALILAVLLVLVSGCGRESNHDHVEYTCPMHPTVIADKPGSCPVCGMDLVRKNTSGNDLVVDRNLSDVLVSTNESVLASIQTVKAEYKSVPIMYEALGMVTYDTRNIFSLPVRVEGRLEKLFIKFPYQRVSKGDKVAEIYSPKLVTAQREFLFLIENDPTNTLLIESARKRLQLLGLTDAQVKALVNRKTALNTFTIFSPYSGYVIGIDAAPGISSPNMEGNGLNDASGGMSGSSAPTEPSQADPALIKEGTYVSAGQTLFQIASNQSMRIELNLPPNVAGTIREGDHLKIDLGTGKEQVTTVDFIQPFFDQDRKFLKIRVNTNQVANLHIGQLLQAKITSDSIQGMWIPREAVVELGEQSVVFIRDKNLFKPAPVNTGVVSQDVIQILKGLTSADLVAANGHYLVDSESTIKTEQ